MSEEAKWYVVHTYSGYENKVKSNIEKVVENRNLQDLIPEVKRGKKHARGRMLTEENTNLS